MSLGSLFCVELTSDTQASVRERLQAYRAALLDELLGDIGDVLTTARLRPWASELYRFVAELYALASDDPQTFSRVVKHWAASLFLTSLIHDEITDTAQLDRITSNLNALLLFERLTADSSVPGDCNYTTTTGHDGEIYGFLRDAQLQLHGRAYTDKRLTWQCSADAVTVRIHDDGNRQLILSRPVRSDASVAFVPFPKAGFWNLPIVEDFAALM